MNQVEETFFKGELNPELNQYFMEKNIEEVLSLLKDEKVIYVLGYPGEDTPFHYIENKNTGKKYIMCFTSLEDLRAWKEKVQIEKPNITIGKMDLIYSLATVEEINQLGGIVFDPCTLNKIVDISLYLEKYKRPEGTILRIPKKAPSRWLSAMKTLFSREKKLQRAYVQEEVGNFGQRYLVILDAEPKVQDKILRKLATLSHKYADLPVVYASLKANPSLENTLEPFYKK